MKPFLAAAAALLLSGAAQAVDYVEVGDAGQTIATAQSTTVTGTSLALTSISGTLTGQDADVFQIYISAPSAFSASTSSIAPSTGFSLDTALFLFDSSGHAIATNDDAASGLSVEAALPVGNILYKNLAAGLYYLGVSISGNEPVNAVNQLLFATGDTTSVRGAASGLNPTILSTFDANSYDSTPGSYTINLTGVTTGAPVAAAVPEAATWAMMVGGFGFIGGTLRRRARAPRLI